MLSLNGREHLHEYFLAIMSKHQWIQLSPVWRFNPSDIWSYHYQRLVRLEALALTCNPNSVTPWSDRSAL